MMANSASGKEKPAPILYLLYTEGCKVWSHFAKEFVNPLHISQGESYAINGSWFNWN